MKSLLEGPSLFGKKQSIDSLVLICLFRSTIIQRLKKKEKLTSSRQKAVQITVTIALEIDA